MRILCNILIGVLAVLVIVACTPWEVAKRTHFAAKDYYYWVRIEWASARKMMRRK